MRLTRALISNFRGLANIDFKIDTPTTVIVGPNAIGKTSILQAIRLARALLMPVFPAEEQLAVQNLGALSPHTGQLSLDTFLRESNQDLVVDLTFRFGQRELDLLKQNGQRLAAQLVETQLGQRGVNQLGLIQYLSSPDGRNNLTTVTKQFTNRTDSMSADQDVRLTLTANPSTGLIQGNDIFIQQMFVLLSRLQPLHMALISYSSADRSLPAGEVTLQIGSADTQQEMQSHIAMPELKHQRLKQYIVGQFLVGEQARTDLESDFALIFGKLLPGKVFKGVGLSRSNALSVRIGEASTGKEYDIDNMSSGEKGLLLTFLVARRRMIPGGLLLLDEPELHLNPAVCKKILPFLIEHVPNPIDLQVLLCTHSPEILASAFERDDCSLFHLKSARELNLIRRRDKEEAFEALKKLGTSTSDVLFFRGGLHVEGSTDADLLEVGFSERIAGLKISRLGGRDEIERGIRTLQVAETRGQLETTQCFILDLDDRPTKLTSTPLVRVLQWDRKCFEHYLLDFDAIYDATREMKKKKNDVARNDAKLKELALKQLTAAVARTVYAPREPENAGARSTDLDVDSYAKMASALSARISLIAGQVRNFSQSDWERDFVAACETQEAQIRSDWESRWSKLADGKRVIEDLHRWLDPGISVTEFKKAIVKAMAQHKTDNWKLVDSILSNALK